MALTVPREQVEHIKKFLELPDDKVEEFLAALSKVGPQFNVADLASEVTDSLDLEPGLVRGIVGVLGSLYLTKNAEDIPTEPFIDQVVSAALKKADTFAKENADAQWAKLRKFLSAALSLERTVGATAKAGHVLTQHERVFSSVQILTDIRSIFHQNVAEKPEAALIIHMLRLTQRDRYNHLTDQYFALDSNDIRKIKTVIDRAMKKEETLKKLMKDSNVTVLDPKESY
jgi:hypothetical protein